MEYNSIINGLFIVFIIISKANFAGSVSTGFEDRAFKLIRFAYNETLPCTIHGAQDFSDSDVQWFVSNDTVKDVQIWPFNFEQNFWKEYDFGSDNSLIIKRAWLHHGGTYTCVIGEKKGIVEAVIFRSHCAFGTEGTKEKLECRVDHHGPRTPNVTWLAGDARPVASQTYRTPSSTTVIAASPMSKGPFECRVYDNELQKTKTACYRGGRITERLSTRPPTKPSTSSQPTTKSTTQPLTTTQPMTTQPTTTQPTTHPTTHPTTQPTTHPSTQKTSIKTTIQSTTEAEKHTTLPSIAGIITSPQHVTIKSSKKFTSAESRLSMDLTSTVLIRHVTTASQATATDHQVQNSTVTTVTPRADSLLWIIVASFLVITVLVATVIALLLYRLKQRQKKQDYLVEKAQDMNKSTEVPLGLKWEKEPDVVRSTASEPMLKKKVLKDDPV